MERKRLLYKSKVEYMSGEGVYTMNHVLGCSHGCRYCYAYRMAKRYGQVIDYEDWCHPKIVENTLELLEEDLSKKRREPIRRVFLSFMTDPFPYLHHGLLPEVREAVNSIKRLSIASIKLINSHDIPVTILTKGIVPFTLLQLHPENEFGATFIAPCSEPTWEPYAATFEDRLENLYQYALRDEHTWASIEPFGLVWPNDEHPHAMLEELLHKLWFVDRIVFGKTNYIPSSYKNPEWYRECALMVESFCGEMGIECIIKKGTVDA